MEKAGETVDNSVENPWGEGSRRGAAAITADFYIPILPLFAKKCESPFVAGVLISVAKARRI